MEKKREHTAFPTTVHTQQLWLVPPKKPGAEKEEGRAECDQNERRTTSNISNTEGRKEEEAATELETEMTLAGKREAGSGDWGVGCRP